MWEKKKLVKEFKEKEMLQEKELHEKQSEIVERETDRSRIGSPISMY